MTMGGSMWQASFPLIATGLRMAGIRVIARRRQTGKTAELMSEFRKPTATKTTAVFVCADEDLMDDARSKNGPLSEGWVITTVNRLERLAEGRRPLDLYIDNGDIAFPSEEDLRKYGMRIKAVTYSIP